MLRPEAFQCEKVLLWSRFRPRPPPKDMENLQESHLKGAQLSADSNNATFMASLRHKKLEPPQLRLLQLPFPHQNQYKSALYLYSHRGNKIAVRWEHPG